MKELTYKHIEITAKPDRSNVIEGRACFFVGNDMYYFSHVSDSEAEILVRLNKYVKEFVERLNSFV